MDFSLVSAATRIIEGSLAVVPGETVVVAADSERVDLGEALVDACTERAANATLYVLDDLRARPHKDLHPTIRGALSDSQASVFLAGFRPGEATMRREFVSWAHRFGLRHAHMVGVTKRAMLIGLAVEPRRVAQVARQVRARLRGDSALTVCHPDQSRLEVRCDPRHTWSEHSGIIRTGRWENLPTGEIVTSPAEVNGVFVCNGAMSEAFGANLGLLRETPVRLTIEQGIVRSVQCQNTKLVHEVEMWMLGARNLNRVGLVSLGTNIGISAPIGEVICDQNMPGLHLALGATIPEKTGASWDAEGQLVFTSAYGNVDLDGTPLIRSGRYLDLS